MLWYKLSKGMRNPWKVLEHIVEYKGGPLGTNVQWTSFLSYQADAELERAPTASLTLGRWNKYKLDSKPVVLFICFDLLFAFSLPGGCFTAAFAPLGEFHSVLTRFASVSEFRFVLAPPSQVSSF